MGVYNMKNIKALLNNPYIKYPLAVISAIAIIKTGYDLGSFLYFIVTLFTRENGLKKKVIRLIKVHRSCKLELYNKIRASPIKKCSYLSYK